MKTIDELYQKVNSELVTKLPRWLTYHNAQHTQYVFEKSVLIGEMEKISGDEMYLLKLAALFHDTGYLVDPKNHEEESCRIAAKELADSELNTGDLNKIYRMIMATKLPQNPQTHLEKILADADLEYLGTDRFEEISEKLYVEILHSRPDLTAKDWHNLQIDFLENHKYFTNFCQTYREPVKQKNLEKVITGSQF